uniref:Uncharacterized protein n=1 Tax=Anopheles atroparvus TaxID=41427 RepID=A0AAG5DWY4_ANOAO
MVGQGSFSSSRKPVNSSQHTPTDTLRMRSRFDCLLNELLGRHTNHQNSFHSHVLETCQQNAPGSINRLNRSLDPFSLLLTLSLSTSAF